MTGFIYELIYVSVFSVLIVSAASPYIGMGSAGVVLTLTGLVISGVMTAFKKLGWSVRFIMTGIIVTIVAAAFLLSRTKVIGELMRSNIVFLWIIPLSIAAFAAGELCARFGMIRTLTTVLLAVACVSIVALGYKPEKLTVISILALALITLTEVIERSWNKSGYTDPREHLVYIAPFLLCSIIFVGLLHAPDNAYDWSFFKDLYRKAYEKVVEISENFGPKDIYDPARAAIGFSGRGELKDELDNRGTDEEMLTLYDIPLGMTSVKLTGRTFDTFDGYEWIDSDISDRADVMIDTLSLLASVHDYTDQSMDYVKKSSLRIKYEKIHTSYVFAPLKTYTSTQEFEDTGIYNFGGDLLWPKTQAFGTEYTIPFYRVNTDNELFADYLKNCTLPSVESFDREAGIFTRHGEKPYTYDDLIDNTKRIRQIYLQPVELSDELKTYMDEVYDGAEDQYDKMSRLQDMLRAFTYSDAPGELPADLDGGGAFLDHFVLNSQKGYCSHFATAFVLLARAEGIPARYVQGYIVPLKSGGPVKVYSSMAHAWPEVYYEGAGWIAYEPTPLYNISSYWRSGEEMREMYNEAQNPYAHEEEAEDESVTDEDEESETGIVIPWYAIVLPIAAGVFLTVLFFAMGNLIVSLGFRKKDAEERFKIMCRQDMNMLKLLDCKMEEGETLREYRIRLLENEDLDDKSLGFISYYNEYLYRGETDISKALNATMLSRDNLKGFLRKLYPLRYLRYYLGFQRA